MRNTWGIPCAQTNPENPQSWKPPAQVLSSAVVFNIMNGCPTNPTHAFRSCSTQGKQTMFTFPHLTIATIQTNSWPVHLRKWQLGDSIPLRMVSYIVSAFLSCNVWKHSNRYYDKHCTNKYDWHVRHSYARVPVIKTPKYIYTIRD